MVSTLKEYHKKIYRDIYKLTTKITQGHYLGKKEAKVMLTSQYINDIYSSRIGSNLSAILHKYYKLKKLIKILKNERKSKWSPWSKMGRSMIVQEENREWVKYYRF